MTQAFQDVRTWVFDLDNTLYAPEMRLFDQIEALMTDFMVRTLNITADAATRLRGQYWRDHGTTLAGLMKHHDVDADAFLDAVHDIDLAHVPEAPDLRRLIGDLPGRKIVYTNGSREHARRVTRARGLDGVFDALYGIEDAGYVPKPLGAAFDRVFGVDGVTPRHAAMFEDDSRNLEHPHRIGMRTVLVGPPDPAPHVHHMTSDLTDFLSQLV